MNKAKQLRSSSGIPRSVEHGQVKEHDLEFVFWGELSSEEM